MAAGYFRFNTILVAQTLVMLSIHVIITSAQRTPVFNPSHAMGQFPQAPWTMFQGMNNMGAHGNSFLRSPFMNQNAFLGPSNYNFNPLQQGWGNGMNNFFNPYQNQPQQEEIYTAIGYDRLDPNSQMRLTITERRNNDMRGSHFPVMNSWHHDDEDYDRPASWYVQGSFLTSQLKNKAGTYHVVLTTGGRTADGCVSASLGNIVTPDMVDASNPFMQFGVGAQPGILPNKLLVGSSGPTVYASTIDGVSRRQLVGSALAACEYVQNGVCGGYIPFCGTVGKDVLPAMEVPLNQNSRSVGVVPFDPTAFQGIGINQGGGGQFGFNDPLAGSGLRTNARDEDESSSSSLGLLF